MSHRKTILIAYILLFLILIVFFLIFIFTAEFNCSNDWNSKMSFVMELFERKPMSIEEDFTFK